MTQALSTTYALLGALNFYVFIILAIRLPSESPTHGMFYAVILGIILLKSLIDMTLAYSFWKLKKWGRDVAIVYSICMILYSILGLKGFQLANLPGADTGTFYAMIHLTISFGTLLACLAPSYSSKTSGTRPANLSGS
jgi:hypothetical protein